VSRHWTAEAAGAVVLSSSTDGVTWKTLTQVNSDEPGVSPQDSQVAINGTGDIALAYRMVKASPKIKHLRVVRSMDNGATWTPPTPDLDSTGGPFGPQIAWGEGRALVLAWLDEGPPGRNRFNVFRRRSSDGGSTWDPETRVTEATEREGILTYAPRLLGDGKGRFWLTWVASRLGRSSLQLVRSVDNGRTWSAPERVSDEGAATYGQSLELVSDNRMLLTWRAQRYGSSQGAERPTRIYARSSRDGGVTWSPTAEVDGLSAAATTSAAGVSSALTDSGEAWVAWHDNRHGRNDIFVARSPDGGATWGAPARLDADAAGVGDSRYPRLAITPDGSAVAVAWEDDRDGPDVIYGRIFSGGQWSAETRLSGTPTPSKTARTPVVVSTSKDAFYVAWELWEGLKGRASQRTIEGVVIRLR
jgi:hypothetical protein